MRFACEDPLGATSRVIDIARRLDLELSGLSMKMTGDGIGILCFQLADPESHAARVFSARVETLVHRILEPPDA